MARIRLHGSGLDDCGNLLSFGNDTHWQLSGGGTGGMYPFVVNPGSYYAGWARSDPEDADAGPPMQWIWKTPDGSGTTPANSPCVFTQVFDLSSCDISTVRLFLSLAADDNAVVSINGTRVLATDPAGWLNVLRTTLTPESVPFIAGMNRIEVTVPNGGGPGGLAIGLRCDADPAAPEFDCTAGRATCNVPIIIPMGGTSYQISVPVPPTNLRMNSWSYENSPGSNSALKPNITVGLGGGHIVISVAALDSPLALSEQRGNTPENASVTVTLSTGAK